MRLQLKLKFMLLVVKYIKGTSCHPDLKDEANILEFRINNILDKGETK